MITKRLASTVSVPPQDKSPRKIVLVGAGFLGKSPIISSLISSDNYVKKQYMLKLKKKKIILIGSYVAKALIADPRNRIQIVSRHPQSRTSFPPPSQIFHLIYVYTYVYSLFQTVYVGIPDPPSRFYRHYIPLLPRRITQDIQGRFCSRLDGGLVGGE